MMHTSEMEAVPLFTDGDDVVRVGNTRVTLDTVIAAFEDGATAEEIAYQYPSLALADVYSVIGYYLHHRDDLDAYLRRRAEQAENVQEQNEVAFDPSGIRKRLLARNNRKRQ